MQKLSRQEEIDLARLIRNSTGNIKDDAVATLCAANHGLLVSIANRMRDDYSGRNLDDRIQDGWLGLRHAALKWPYDKNIKFSTYATLHIKKHIRRAGNSLVTVPINFEKKSKVQTLKVDPPAPQQADITDAGMVLRAAKPFDRLVLRLNLGLGGDKLSGREIGKIFGVTRQRIGQHVQQAYRDIRRAVR